MVFFVQNKQCLMLFFEKITIIIVWLWRKKCAFCRFFIKTPISDAVMVFFYNVFPKKRPPDAQYYQYFPPIQNPPLWGISLFKIRSILLDHEHHSRLIWRKSLFFLSFFEIRSRSHQCKTMFLRVIRSKRALFCDFF